MNQVKPKHLGLTYAEQFKEEAVVDAYAHRPPIPDAVFGKLMELIVAKPRAVLDAGFGMGPVARRLAPLVARVDAVDFSRAMIEAGRQLPNGAHPHLRWIESSVEDAPLEPPYGLMVAAGSLHWMEWNIVMPRFRPMLAPNAVLAIVWQSEVRQPWRAAQLPIIQRYSTNQDFAPYNLINELSQRRLLSQLGEYHTEPVAHPQPVADYIESFHSRNGFSRQRMTPASAQAFDEYMHRLMSDAYPDGIVPLEVVGYVVWGRPL